MENFVKVASMSNLAPGEMTQVRLENRRICLSR
jgi:hypothetical protein